MEEKDIFFGRLQNIKIELIKMINEGQDTYSIVLSIAKQLEDISGEKGYKNEIKQCLTNIYGIGLGEEKPLKILLDEALERKEKLSLAKDKALSSEVQKRIDFALEEHKKYIDFLKDKLKK